jgi:hypothetical protein
MTFWRGNMKNVQEGGFSLQPEGEFEFEIFDVEERHTSSGDPMALVKMRVPGSDCEVWDNLVFPLPNSKAIKILRRSKHFLHCLGVPHEEEDSQVNPQSWKYKRVRAKIKHETYINKDNQERKKASIESYLLKEDHDWDDEWPDL